MRQALTVRMLLSAGLMLTMATACGRGDEDAPADGGADLAAQDMGEGSVDADSNPVADAEGSDEASGDASAEDEGSAAGAEAAEAEGDMAVAGRIDFEPGREGGIVSGELSGGGDTERYVLRALAGQTMSLRLTGVSNGSIDIELAGSDAQVVASNAGAVAAELNNLSLTLPETGDYTISLTAIDGAPRLEYQLEIRVTGEGLATEGDAADADAADGADAGADGGGASGADGDMAPIEVRFEAGADAAAFDGSLERGDIVAYALRAAAGQQLAVEVDSQPAGSVDVMVFDTAGRPMRALRGITPPTFELREDGDYSVTASNPNTDGSVGYDIRFTIVDASDADEAADDGAAADVTSGAETQIFFTLGERSTTVQGSLAAGGEARYRMAADGGQTLQLSLSADSPDLFQVYVEDAAGNLLGSGLEADGLSVELPKRQDYVVVLIAQPGAPEAMYALTVAIE